MQLCCINLWTEWPAVLWFFMYVFTQMPSENHLFLHKCYHSGDHSDIWEVYNWETQEKKKHEECFICIYSLLYQGFTQAHSKQPPRPPTPAGCFAYFPELLVQHQWGNGTTAQGNNGEERRGEPSQWLEQKFKSSSTYDCILHRPITFTEYVIRRLCKERNKTKDRSRSHKICRTPISY